MKLDVTTTFHTGDPKGVFDRPNCSLVDGVYLIQRDNHLEVVINTDYELMCTGSDPDSICFDFSKDDEWQGWYYTSVRVTAENDAEKEIIKGNQFRQHEKGQYVFVILPWEDEDTENIVALWEKED